MSFKTFQDLDPLPASDVNTYLMNQVVARFADAAARDAAIPGPAEGQLVYVVGLGVQIYYSGWRPLPGTVIFRGKRTIATTVANGAAVGLDEESLDLYGGHSTTTNTSRYTCPFAGQFTVMAAVRHGVMSSGKALTATLRKSGSVITTYPNCANNSPSAGTMITFADTIDCTGGDYLEVGVGNADAAATDASNTTMVIVYSGL